MSQVTLAEARIANVPWWRRVLARWRGDSVELQWRYVEALYDENIRQRLNKQLSEILEHVHDRDVQIRVLQQQVRELGAEPIVVRVIRKPLPTFIPGAGVSVRR